MVFVNQKSARKRAQIAREARSGDGIRVKPTPLNAAASVLMAQAQQQMAKVALDWSASNRCARAVNRWELLMMRFWEWQYEMYVTGLQFITKPTCLFAPQCSPTSREVMFELSERV